MIPEVWLDANVVLRYLLADPPDLFARAKQVMDMAEAGRIRLRLSTLTLAEIVWVLESFYQYPRSRVAEVVGAFANASGVLTDEAELVQQALTDYAERNVDFVDAYLAARAVSSGQAVCTFDEAHFKRLGAEMFRPWSRPAGGRPGQGSNASRGQSGDEGAKGREGP